MRNLSPIARRENARGVLRVIALSLALLGLFAGQVIELGEDIGGQQFDLAWRRARARFLPFGQSRKKPFLSSLGPLDVGSEHLRPRPTQPLQRLQARPRARALKPVGLFHGRDHRSGGALEKFGHRFVARRFFDLKRFG